MTDKNPTVRFTFEIDRENLRLCLKEVGLPEADTEALALEVEKRVKEVPFTGAVAEMYVRLTARLIADICRERGLDEAVRLAGAKFLESPTTTLDVALSGPSEASK